MTIPSTVTTLGASAFSRCYKLTNIHIPASVTSIDDTFYFSGLNAITVDSNNQQYSALNGVLFNKDRTTLILYPEQKTLTSYTIPSTVTTIGVGYSAFIQQHLQSIVIPSSVTAISRQAFYACKATALSFEGMTAPTIATSPAFGSVPATGTLYYPEGASGYTKGVFGMPNLDGWDFVAVSASAPYADRLAGNDRFETAALASQKAFPDAGAVDTAIVAFSHNYADALAASTLAGVVNAPILLSQTAELNAATLAELKRLAPSKVYITGGTSVIADDVKAQIEALAGVSEVTRLGGDDRYATAKLIADEAVALGAVTDEVYLATGKGFADALAAGSFAVSEKVPLLLTPADTLSTQVTDFITAHGVKSVTIIGGTSAVDQPSEDALKAKGITVTRLGGIDRYATGELVATSLIERYDLTPKLFGIASAVDFPDALSGGAAIGIRGGVLLLTNPNAVSPAVSSVLIEARKYSALSLEFLGGDKAISAETEAAINALAQS